MYLKLWRSELFSLETDHGYFISWIFLHRPMWKCRLCKISDLAENLPPLTEESRQSVYKRRTENVSPGFSLRDGAIIKDTEKCSEVAPSSRPPLCGSVVPWWL